MRKLFALVLLFSLFSIVSACSRPTMTTTQAKTFQDGTTTTLATTESSTNQTVSTTTSAETSATSMFRKGDLVLFGRYYNESILWEIMTIEKNNITIWSKHILTAKCFDAAESGTYYSGQSDTDRFGSNNWQDSNIRDWLNTRGLVNWKTQPPAEAAVDGKGFYDTEPGFLSDFSDADYQMIQLIERPLLDFNENILYTTSDRVFLASIAEVKSDGKWGLSQSDLSKTPTEAAMANNKNIYPDARLACMYFLLTPGSDEPFQVYGVSDDGRFWVGDACVSTYGIAPVLVITPAKPVSGSGTPDDPWVFN